MKIQENNIQQKEYQAPQIYRIDLDREISLQLASEPPVPSNGDEVYNKPEYFNNDPYKVHQV